MGDFALWARDVRGICLQGMRDDFEGGSEVGQGEPERDEASQKGPSLTKAGQRTRGISVIFIFKAVGAAAAAGRWASFVEVN